MGDEKRRCDTTEQRENIIRSTSSSLLLCAPSWSSGLGGGDANEDEIRCRLPSTFSPASNGNNCPAEPPNGNSNSRLRTTASDNQSTSNYASNPKETSDLICPKISIQIPTVYLTRTKKDSASSSSSSFHVYKLEIETSNNCKWSVYRRYSKFLALHQKLKAQEPQIGKFPFPPKRRLNSKASTIVQERRNKLENYMRLLCDFVSRLPVDSQSDTNTCRMLYDLTSNRSSGTTPFDGLYNSESLSAELNPQTEDSNRSIGERLANGENIIEEAVVEEEEADGDEEVASKASDEAAAETQSVSSFFNRRRRVDSGADRFEASVAISASQTTRGEETADHCTEPNSAKKQSVRWLFYNFIAPNGGGDELQPSSQSEK